MKTKGLLRVFIVSVIGGFFALNAGAVFAGDTFKIGVIAPFKTSLGESVLNGAILAVKDINAQGGILGKQVELIMANTEFKPEKGATAYKKLVLKDKVNAVFGTCSSGVSKAVMDQMARFKKIFVSTGAASPALSDLVASNRDKYKYWFRVMCTSKDISNTILSFIYDVPFKQHGLKRIAIMAENALWTKGLVNEAKVVLEQRGMEIVYSELFDIQTKDFTTILTKIAETKADFIYELSAHVDGSTYIKQWYDLKGAPIGGDSGAAQAERYWYDSNGKCVNETVNAFGGSFPVAETPKTIPFFNKYKDEFKTAPGFGSGYTYDAFFVYKNAVEKARSTDPNILVPIIERTNYIGVSGRIEFTPNHDPKHYGRMPMVQWREGNKREVVWPPNLAASEWQFPPWWK
ncbi:MAG: ABC transporter substrate-binding protein [Deltaproteobacteria bacterium]|nr:ABC transporter substrate-binding protein [Deltaproteobacteria bacterium]